MDSRFAEHHKKFFALCSLLTGDAQNATWASLESAWQKYRNMLPDTFADCIKGEYQVKSAMWKRKGLDANIPKFSAIDLNHCSKAVFPNVFP